MRLRDMQILSLGYLIFSLLPSTGYSYCMLYNAIGEPCPGCGMTRAIHALLSGNLLAALSHNPISFLLLPALCFFAVTPVWPRAAGFYERHRGLFSLGILGGAFLLLLYGGFRILVLEGVMDPMGLPVARFSEPALLPGLLRTFLH